MMKLNEVMGIVHLGGSNLIECNEWEYGKWSGKAYLENDMDDRVTRVFLIMSYCGGDVVGTVHDISWDNIERIYEIRNDKTMGCVIPVKVRDEIYWKIKGAMRQFYDIDY